MGFRRKLDEAILLIEINDAVDFSRFAFYW
jgi:hypothetical protein